jgi:thiosulfate sulfurtransferase
MKSKSTAQLTPKPMPLSASQLEARREKLLVLDVRSWLEYLLGHIPGAQKFNRERVLKDIPKHQSIAIACLSGHRSPPIARWLVDQGYQNVYNLQGGLMAWKKAGYSVKIGTKP